MAAEVTLSSVLSSVLSVTLCKRAVNGGRGYSVIRSVKRSVSYSVNRTVNRVSCVKKTKAYQPWNANSVFTPTNLT